MNLCSMKLTVNYAQKFISYLAENTIHPYYKDQRHKYVPEH